MKKKILPLILAVTMTAVCFAGCDKSEENATPTETVNSEVQPEDSTTATQADTTIQEELDAVEATYQEKMNAIDSESATQSELNQNAADCYQLWDDELNSLWDRLSAELDSQRKENLLGEQRQWNERKETEIKNAGEEAEGGTLQPLLECSKGAQLTRERCYYFAGILAEVRGETFTVSDAVQADLDAANPTLDDVFQSFQGQYFFDAERGAVIGIEPTDECDYGMPGTTWTVWVTGGDLMSDLDVIDYTGSTIDFKTASGAYYQLGHTMAGGVSLDYGTERGVWTETIYGN
ncbi:MAG: DUF1311 domain-containing protein [Lachnospiraceae bacterium]|nr:DUF1311 domain-containing protein [Lachnospiraceae bacterium]